MSGFVAGLAARNAGRSRVVEPRRMPFEPRAEPLVEPPHEAVEEPASDPTASVERAPPLAAPPRRPATTAARPARRPPATVQPLLPPERPGPEPKPIRVEARGRGRPPSPSPPEAPTVAEPVVAVEPPEALPPGLVPRPSVQLETVTRLRETVRAAVPPVVHVTIGRVEVRAVQEPTDPRPRRRPKPPPPMTLDEYLARGRP